MLFNHLTAAVFVIAWSLAAVGYAAGPISDASQTGIQPLREILADNFSQDTRKNYEASPGVTWEAGSLKLAEQATLSARAEAGTRAEWQLDLEVPDANRSVDVTMRIELDNQKILNVHWNQHRQNDQRVAVIQLELTSTKDGKPLSQRLREFPLSETSCKWTIRFTSGLICLLQAEQVIGKCYLGEPNSVPVKWSLESSKDEIRLHSVRFAALPRATALSAADTAKLAKAQAAHEAGLKLHRQGRYTQAEQPFKEVLESYRQIFGNEHPRYGTAVFNLGENYRGMGLFAKAEPLFLEACRIQGKCLGTEHPLYARMLKGTGVLYLSAGDYSKVESLLLQAREIVEATFGVEHSEYAAIVNDLAGFYQTTGNYVQAQEFFARACEIRLKVDGGSHPSYAGCLSSFANLYIEMHEFGSAESLLLQAREIYRNAHLERNPDYALILNNLGGLYQQMGDYSQAEPLLAQACDIFQSTLGKDHPQYANSLNVLANIYCFIKEYAKAEKLLLEVSDIRRRVIGEDHLDYSKNLLSLASLYYFRSEYEKAEPLLVQACSIRKRALGETHPSYLHSLNNLAMTYNAMNDFGRAEPLLTKVRDVRQQVLGELHPDFVDSVNNLGFLYASEGKFQEAAPLFLQSLTARTKNTLKIITGLSESRSHEFVGSNLFGLAMFLSSCRQLDSISVADAYATVCDTQSLVSRTIRARRARTFDDPEAQKLFLQLQATQQQLAQWTLLSPYPGQEVRRTQRLQELNTDKEQLERALAQSSEKFRGPGDASEQPVTPTKLMHVLPADVAVVHLLKTDVRQPSESKRGLSAAAEHYEAFVLTHGSNAESTSEITAPCRINWIHLGPVLPIDQLLKNWRQQLQSTDERGVKLSPTKLPAENLDNPNTTPAATLKSLVWDKIQPHLAGCKTVVLIPDGDLHFLPWGALPGDHAGSFLIEEYSIAVAQDAQQLYRPLTSPPHPSNGSFLLIGGVNYDEQTTVATADPKLSQSGLGMKRSAKNLVWPNLPGTQIEIQHLSQLAGNRETVVLTGSDAQEMNLRNKMPQARFIHLATHGFFADESFRSSFQRDLTGEQLFGAPRDFVTATKGGVTYRNPLLLSGIVLAGANRRQQMNASGNDSGPDGILTAEEVVNLDLRQTDLVVLSACETGLGRVGGGEGVFGLQRAFTLAGARTTVASLWRVNDDATQMLMTEFYRNLWDRKMSKLESLRQAQLTMLRRYDPSKQTLRGINPQPRKLPNSPSTEQESSPYYWAAFSLSGDWQ